MLTTTIDYRYVDIRDCVVDHFEARDRYNKTSSGFFGNTTKIVMTKE